MLLQICPAFCDIPLLEFKIGVWYTLNAHKIIGTILFEERNSSQYTFINSNTFLLGIMRRSVNAGLCKS